MFKKKTQAEFIENAHMVHGDRYDYTEVEYHGSQEKVRIICRKHGAFSQLPSAHLSGQGCPQCAKEKSRCTQEEFEALVKIVHGDKYSLEKAKYVNNSTKVIIICPKHGEFLITPDRLIHAKQGCKKCGHERIGLKLRLSQEDFINRASKVHDGKYSYYKVQYVESHTRVIITCPIHGDFEQLAYHHLNGHGCPKCGLEEAKINESTSYAEFVKRAQAKHGLKYDYSKVKFSGINDSVCIICPSHGEFWQVANTHLRGHGCPQCSYEELSRKKTKPQDLFIEQAKQIHGDKYDYSEVVYVSAIKKVAIRCKYHDKIFWQKPNAHLNGNGCPLCAQSHLEQSVLMFLKAQQFHFEVEKTFDWLVYKDHMYLDFFLPEYSVAIECQGEQHFHSFDYFGGAPGLRLIKKRDIVKRQLCESHGIKVLYYSDLGIHYPYEVIESHELLLEAIKNRGYTDNSDLWKMPELPFNFDNDIG